MFKTNNMFEDQELMDLAKKKNYCAPMQNATAFPINADGRTLLIGIDVDKSKMDDLSMHCTAANQEEYFSDGHSVTAKEYFIESAVKLFEKQLRKAL